MKGELLSVIETEFPNSNLYFQKSKNSRAVSMPLQHIKSDRVARLSQQGCLTTEFHLLLLGGDKGGKKGHSVSFSPLS